MKKEVERTIMGMKGMVVAASLLSKEDMKPFYESLLKEISELEEMLSPQPFHFTNVPNCS